MKNPFFNPDNYVYPSLNRVVLAALPGLPTAVQGKTAYELLRADALRQRVAAKADALGLDGNAPDLLAAFDRCLAAGSPVAQEIAAEYGRFLAYLLLVLKRGDAVNRAARTEWGAAHWAWWGQIERVWLGGGLLRGELGKTAVFTAQQTIQPYNLPNFTVNLSPYGVNLPLYGLATLAPAGTQAMLLADLGHTSIKQAVAFYGAGQLTRLQLLPTLPSGCNLDQSDRESILAHVGYVADQLAALWRLGRSHGWPLAPTIAVSLACYLVNGQPSPGQSGCYGRLRPFSPNLTDWLGQLVSQRVGESVQLHLQHDGTAAALAHGESGGKTAVITCGTALGIGFVETERLGD